MLLGTLRAGFPRMEEGPTDEGFSETIGGTGILRPRLSCFARLLADASTQQKATLNVLGSQVDVVLVAYLVHLRVRKHFDGDLAKPHGCRYRLHNQQQQ